MKNVCYNNKKRHKSNNNKKRWLDIVFAAVGAGGCDHHNFGDKVDDGRGRLFGFQLGKNVALVIRFAGRLPGDEAEATAVNK